MKLHAGIWISLMESIGGAGEDRTRDLLTASQALSQLSYSPTIKSNAVAALILLHLSMQATVSTVLPCIQRIP